jgi:hypothetical protein
MFTKQGQGSQLHNINIANEFEHRIHWRTEIYSLILNLFSRV